MSDNDPSKWTAIQSLTAEVEYWTEISQKYSELEPEVTDRAAMFAEFLQPVAADLVVFNDKPVSGALDLLERCQDAFDQCWKVTQYELFPRGRMEHLFGLITFAIEGYVQNQFESVGLFEGDSDTREMLRKPLQLCERWRRCTATLTGQYWSGFEKHKWTGEPFEDKNLMHLQKRISSVAAILALDEQLKKLLSAVEQVESSIGTLLEPFKRLRPFDVSPNGVAAWDAAKQQYDDLMSPIEKKVTGKLRMMFAGLGDQTYQLLREFQRYRELIKLPAVSRDLASEREVLLGQLSTFVGSIREDFESRSKHMSSGASAGEEPLQARNLPEVVNNIVWVKSIINKVEHISSTANSLLSDLPRMDSFKTTTKDLADDLMTYQKEQFKFWVKDMDKALNDSSDPIALEMSGRLMELNLADDVLEVNFSERLVTLLREVRQLTALGFKIPRNLRQAAETAQKFYRHGMVLKQVASFFNNMSTQIIPSQKGMLLESALAFEKAVGVTDRGEVKQVTWDNAGEVEAYVERLQSAAEKLTTENRKLRKYHTMLSERVVALMNIDLLKHEQQWRDKVREIRTIIDGLAKTGYDNTQPWRTHWDHQLYKALEFQYRLGLESLNENLTEIKVDLTYRNGQIQFRPTFEEIRSRYFGTLKRFIKFPLQFKGVGDSDIFANLVSRNGASLVVVYKKADDLFARLALLTEQFEDWTVLGNRNLERYCSENLHEVKDWEANFRMLKVRGREADRVPLEAQVDCIHVSFQPIVNAVHDIMQRFNDALVASLTGAINNQMKAVGEFIDEGQDKLSDRPSTIEEIGEANIKYKEVVSMRPEIAKQFESAKFKNLLLRQVAGGGVNLGELENRWDGLTETMESHQLMVSEQLETMKSEVDSRALNLNQSLLKFTERWADIKPDKVAMHDRVAAQTTLQTMKEVRREFDELIAVRDKIAKDCDTFDMGAPQFPGMETLEDDIKSYEESWTFYDEFATALDEHSNEPWSTFRNKLYLFEDFVEKWYEKVKDLSGNDPVSRHLRGQLETFRQLQPHLKNVRGEALSQEHWAEVYRLLGMPKGVPSSELTFSSFLNVGDKLIAHENEIKAINARAQGEISIREALAELKAWGAEAEYAFFEHDTGTPLIKDWKDLMTQVGDNQSLQASLKDSPYYKLFASEADRWEGILGTLDQALNTLVNVQRRWVYLQPVMSKGALPAEQGRFQKIDSEFKDIMQHSNDGRLVVHLTEYPGVVDKLSMLLDQLERVQKALAAFLEEKRGVFPRFYFIGDDDLLEILGQAQNPAVIQTHLKKLFQGIFKVKFDANHKRIMSMISSAGEEVDLETPVTVTDKVDDWLAKLSDEMKETLQISLVRCMDETDITRYPSMITCCAEYTHFTAQAEVAINRSTLPKLKKQLEEQLANYTSFDSTDTIARLSVKALVLDIIHNMDVVDQLVGADTTDTAAWQWSKQLRYYLDDDQISRVKMVDASMYFTYEYQGNAPKLVHTPLTDKCYLTLTQGIKNGYGGNPYGPAGTGKTESVKALGGALARQVLVFNCDEGIDFKSMGRIFIGLVKCGAWGCFDEFNRLDEGVLSAVSQQIQIIQSALMHGEKNMQLLGQEVNVDLNSGIFVTLNPAGKGYGARSKLPDNLKVLFRSVAMSVPDLFLIAETILYSEGFVHARELGRKLVNIFLICRQLLSYQQHYDWGLRALKSILNVGGKILQAKLKEGEKQDKTGETIIVVQAMNVNTLSKLTFDDGIKFNALVADVFPGLEISESGLYADLERACKEVLQDMKLDVMPYQVSKVLQFSEACSQRMGVCIVGPSGSGKTTLWRVCEGAFAKLNQQLVKYVCNPKSLPRQRLLGHMDMDTREWNDGVLTDAARKVVIEPPEVHNWIICDGDIDPAWIESLNSVLDDNRLFTMPSGERIQFQSNVNFIFETNSLKWASPATVSRMGMIFLSEEDMDLKALVNAWLRRREPDEAETLRPMIEKLYYKALEWSLDHIDQCPVATTQNGLVKAGLSHLGGCKSTPEFVTALIRGFGSNFELELRTEFAREVFSWAGENPVDSKKPLLSYYDPATLQYRQYDNSRAEPVKAEELASEPVVSTIDVQMNEDILLKWIEEGDPVIVVGPEGAGKSMTLRHCFSKVKNSSVAVVPCSSQTTADIVIQKLNTTCGIFSSVKGRVYRPKEGNRMILYLKDVNLPKPDAYDTMELIMFLQQISTYQGFYNADLEFMNLEGISIVCSMNPPTTVGRYPLNTRFTALSNILVIDYPAREQLQVIYSNYADAALAELAEHPQWQSKLNRDKLAVTCVDVFEEIRTKWTQSERGHYLYTPRDITRLLLGMGQRFDLQKQELLEVLAVEAQRIFGDRLVTHDDQVKLQGIVAQILQAQWNFSSDMTGSVFTTWGEDATPEAEFEKTGIKKLSKLTLPDFRVLVDQGLEMYERELQDLGIQVFPEVLEHIARLDRVLALPGGHCLLVGRSGVGRGTALKLTAYMHHYQYVSPNITKDYGVKNFQVDLKAVMAIAGIEGKRVVFHLEDHQLQNDAFIEMINSLLSSGEVPGLYEAMEIEPLVAPIKDEMMSEGFFGAPFAYFSQRVLKNVHVVLSMDDTNPRFLARAESNPALYTRMNLQWWNTWSAESMKTLPRMLLENLLKSLPSGDTILEAIAQIHDSAVEYGAAPRHIGQFALAYETIYTEKRQAEITRQSRLQGGLSKLSEAAETVDILSQDAAKKKILVAEKQEQADKALVEITTSMEGASVQKREMETLQSGLAVENEKMAVRKAEVDQRLSGIQPILDKARAAVGNINPRDLTEIKALKTPPIAIRDVLSAVVRLMGQKDISWEAIKVFLAGRGVVQNILNFDAHNVKKSERDAVKAIIKERGNSFKEDVITKASKAATPLASWSVAMLSYSEVLESVGPLEKELRGLESGMASSKQRLGELKSGLEEVEVRVAGLRENFEKMTKEAAFLKIELEKTEGILIAAQDLIGKLSGERTRWETDVVAIGKGLEAMPTSACLAAAFTTYLSSTSENVREKMLAEWSSLLKLEEKFRFNRFLSSETELLEWKSEGLPGDDLSMENAVVITRGVNVPFLIDPTTQATQWLMEHCKDKKLEATTQEDERFQNTLELACRFGKTLVIQEVDYIFPLLVPILRRDFTVQGPRRFVQIGDKLVDFHDDFKLYLTTRNANPDLPPDMAALVSVVNFSITFSGLEGQLLSRTVKHDKPELEEKKSQALKTEEESKVQMVKLEQQLLVELASSEGNILENKALLDSLNETKSRSIELGEALKAGAELQVTLDKEREGYRPVATTGAMLFFMLAQLDAAEHMYQYSLPWFLKHFDTSLAIEEGERPTTRFEDRIRVVIEKMRKIVFAQVSRSLFKRDRLTFGMHMVHEMFPEMFGENEWELFTGKIISVSASGDIPSWAPAERKGAFLAFSETLPKVTQTLMLRDSEAWSAFARSNIAEKDFPIKYAKQVTNFQRLLLLQAARPDRMESAMQNFVCEALDIPNLSPGSSAIENVYSEMTNEDPVLFVTSPGSDPSADLLDFAVEKVGKDNFIEVAMGQGQQEVARKAVIDGAKEGQWVCLKNLHLAIAWLPTLEKILTALQPHEDFRLWLTTEPHAKFSAILLKQSIKITFEAPPGVKKNIERSMSAWSDEYIADGSVLRAQSLFVLAWFHAVLQERRSYIPQGYVKFYEFGAGEFKAATEIIEIWTKQARGGGSRTGVDWEAIHGLFEYALYGGRVDNDFDFSVLGTYLRIYFCDAILAKGAKEKIARNVTLPDSVAKADFMKIVEALPEQDDPEIFCLPSNIGRTIQRANSAYVIATLKRFSGSSDFAARFDREEWYRALKPILDLWYKLTQSSSVADMSKVAKKPAQAGENSESNPLNDFVVMEYQRAKQLIAKINSELTHLGKVLMGKALITPDDRTLAVALLRGEVPGKWDDVWEGPEDPFSWIQGAAKRTIALEKWLDRAKGDQVLTAAANLAELFRPDVFLNALRQQTARVTSTAVDSLKLISSPDLDVLEKHCKVTLQLEGLLIEGGVFGRGKVDEMHADAPTISPLGRYFVGWVPDVNPEPYPEKEMVTTPMYTTSSRAQYVGKVNLPCTATPEKWILAGVAIILTSDQ